MIRKSHIDLIGALALIAFALNLGFNQVVIKWANGGFQPVFMAGLRSLGAGVVLLAWMWARGVPMGLPRAAWFGGVLAGILFAVEFILLFLALDLTSVARTSILFYAMPVWLSLAAHFVLPGERLTRLRVLGLGLAMTGVVIAVADRGGAPGNLWGDLMAMVAAMCWAGIVLCVRLTPLNALRAEQQLLWQLLVSIPFLMGAAFFFGDFVRDLAWVHVVGLAYQILAVASFGFLFWFWLIKIYPASGVASFSFLSPVFAVLLGWLILAEEVGLSIWAALGLVAVGLILINRR